MCAFLSHAHYWYVVGMLKVPAIEAKRLLVVWYSFLPGGVLLPCDPLVTTGWIFDVSLCDEIQSNNKNACMQTRPHAGSFTRIYRYILKLDPTAFGTKLNYLKGQRRLTGQILCTYVQRSRVQIRQLNQ